MLKRLENFVEGAWQASRAVEALKVLNPASAQALAEVPLSPPEEVDAAATAAQKAFPEWRHRPAGERIQPLFKLKALLEENLDDLARTRHRRVRQDVRRERQASCGAPLRMWKWLVASHP